MYYTSWFKLYFAETRERARKRRCNYVWTRKCVIITYERAVNIYDVCRRAVDECNCTVFIKLDAIRLESIGFEWVEGEFPLLRMVNRDIKFKSNIFFFFETIPSNCYELFLLILNCLLSIVLSKMFTIRLWRIEILMMNWSMKRIGRFKSSKIKIKRSSYISLKKKKN